MNNFYQMLQQLQQTASRNEKIKIVYDNIVNDIAIYHYLMLCLNPMLNYGFSKIPRYDKSKQGYKRLEDVVDVFDHLASVNRSNDTINLVIDTLQSLKEQDRYCFEKIILKDLRCGVQASTVNSAVNTYNETHEKQLQPIFDYPCMLVASYSDKLINKLDFDNDQYPVYSQLKCDGMRFNAVVNHNKVDFYGRSGKPIYITNQQLIDQFIQLANGRSIVFDGELLVEDNGSILDRKTGNGILNKAVKGTISDKEQQMIVATLWDVISIDDFTAGYQKEIPQNYYTNRWNLLTSLFEDRPISRIRLVESKIVDNKDQAFEMFHQMLARHEEGVIVKSGKNVWRNTRTSDFVKLKAELDCELIVESVFEGSGKYQQALGSIECVTSDRAIVVGVGSGFTEQQRFDLWKIKDELIGKIVTVKYNGRITDKAKTFDSLFLPRFVEFREDKDQPTDSCDIK